MNAHQFAIQANGSFALPDACFRVKSLMEQETSTIEQFANVISIDPSMTSRLLQIANSPIYSFSGEISTISRAITLIGTKAIYNMMLIDVTASAFAHFGNDSIDLKRFWRMSVFCGLATKNLAINAGIRDIERLFIAGLLQNFGELIIAKVSPELANDCQAFWSEQLPWEKQKQVLGFSYSEISTALLTIWQLPEKIIMPIRHCYDTEVYATNKDVSVLYLSFFLALADSFPGIDFGVEKAVFAHCEFLDFDQEDLATAKAFANKEAENITKIINAEFYS